MIDLSTRQSQVLKAIIEEYMETAEAVGSETLEKKYNLGVSPATIRNEMAELTEKGFLKQPHTSAGRTPTPIAMRFYVEHLMQEKKLSLTDEVKTKEELWDARGHQEKLLHETALALASRTKTLAIVSTDQGDVYFAGAANILQMPEFYDIDVAHTVLSLLDQQTKLKQLFFGPGLSPTDVHIIFGEDLDWPYFDAVGMAFTHFPLGHNHVGSLSVVGTSRLNFPYVIPTLRYFATVLSQVTANW